MRQTLIRWCLCFVGMALLPALALAQSETTAKEEPPDMRLDGFSGNVLLPLSSTAMAWVVLIILGLVCVGVMFKNAKRTHLD